MPGLGGLGGGPLGPFGAGGGHMGGLPHGLPPGMLKAPPPEMQQHREDNMKGPLGQVADDRLVSGLVLLLSNNTVTIMCLCRLVSSPSTAEFGVSGGP